MNRLVVIRIQVDNSISIFARQMGNLNHYLIIHMWDRGDYQEKNRKERLGYEELLTRVLSNYHSSKKSCRISDATESFLVNAENGVAQ